MTNIPVLLIHGTGASCESNQGESWWQIGGSFRTKLDEKLTRSGSKANSGTTVFHWSGANWEKARRVEAYKLLDLLLTWEEDPTVESYHLICHSHGGTLAWRALCSAFARGRRLSKLQTWSTLGTPFVQFRPIGVTQVILRLGLLVLLSAAIAGAVGAVIDIIRVSVTQSPSAPFLLPGESEQDISAAEAWTVVFVVVLLGLSFAYVIGAAAIQILGSIVGAISLRRESSVSVQAFVEYGGKWIGVWHPRDEAISLLNYATGMSFNFFSTGETPAGYLSTADRVFVLVTYPFRRINRLVWRWIGMPLGNRFVNMSLRDAILGHNLPGSEVASVSTTPIEFGGLIELPKLPDSIASGLSERANAVASDSIEEIRLNLVYAGWSPQTVDLARNLGNELSLKELNHCQYFDDAEIQDLLVDAITGANNSSFVSEFRLKMQMLASSRD